MEPHPEIRSDERGAIMIIALFFAVFGVSILYLGIGAGESVLFREHLQDAVDSAALSGAITQARIMNVLVLINMVMVTLLAILVALKLVEAIAILGMAIAAGLAWCTAGATLAAVPPLKALQSTVSTIYEEAKDPIFQALETLRSVGNQMSEAAPTIAESMAMSTLRGTSDGLFDSGFAATTAERLPVTDDTFEGLCGKAGVLAKDIAILPLKVIPGWGALSSALDDPMEALTSSLSKWFCGDGENSVPDLSQDMKTNFPETDQAAACKASDPESFTEGQEKDASSEACRMADAESAAGKPDDAGNCKEQCGPGGPYDLATTKARSQCDPLVSPLTRQYRFQVQEGYVKYKWDGTGWIRGEPHFQTSMLVGPTDTMPCAETQQGSFLLTASVDHRTECGRLTTAGYFRGYNMDVHTADDRARILPACTNECAPQELPRKDEGEPQRIVMFRQVTHVFSCERMVHTPVEVHLTRKSPNSEAKKQDKEGEGNSKSPKRIVKDVTLGSEPFQFRTLAIAGTERRESARLVRMGLWKHEDPANPLGELRADGGFAFAQSEYFYDGTGGPNDWMWRMNWRGRLKRFEIPKASDANRELTNHCRRSVSGSDCTRLLRVLDDWTGLIVH